ncbi:MAG: SulP family inorganic anion transporter [Gammaproteobacteria bacterium]|nr:SulP family inorganic anion transporter [Gammaproteobacteria bacterium]
MGHAHSPELHQSTDQFHLPTVVLGLSMLAALIALRRLLPQLPSALLVTILGILVVFGLDLDQKGISVLGTVPARMPNLTLVLPTFLDFREILTGATAIALLSFISGILTVKSFARRSSSGFDSNQELIGFGASNIVSGLARGFPIAGGCMRTAVALAMGGMSQLAGIVAAVTMLLVLFFLTGTLAYVPEAALAAVIIVSGWSLLDLPAFCELYTAKHLELGLSLVAMLGVLILGVLPGVATAVGLSLAWLVYVESVPPDAILGRVPGLWGYHNVKQIPEAETEPGVLIYQFRANIVFFNAERFKARILEAISASDIPVEWVVVDTSPINYVDLHRREDDRRATGRVGVTRRQARRCARRAQAAALLRVPLGKKARKAPCRSLLSDDKSRS